VSSSGGKEVVMAASVAKARQGRAVAPRVYWSGSMLNEETGHSRWRWLT